MNRDMNEKCCQIIIKGKVQGVFFRKFTKSAANSFGIKGFVKNQTDGSVYIEASGENEKMEQFIQWCHKGPDNARVENVSVNEIPIKEFSSFEIKYF